MKCALCRKSMSIEYRIMQGRFMYFWYCCDKCHQSFLMKVPSIENEGGL
ncbi:MAG: hypothetical protein AB1454_09825 [Candidatus Auribacterota bacterium]|jgi:hypothetical protein